MEPLVSWSVGLSLNESVRMLNRSDDGRNSFVRGWNNGGKGKSKDGSKGESRKGGKQDEERCIGFDPPPPPSTHTGM